MEVGDETLADEFIWHTRKYNIFIFLKPADNKHFSLNPFMINTLFSLLFFSVLGHV